MPAKNQAAVNRRSPRGGKRRTQEQTNGYGSSADETRKYVAYLRERPYDSDPFEDFDFSREEAYFRELIGEEDSLSSQTPTIAELPHENTFLSNGDNESVLLSRDVTPEPTQQQLSSEKNKQQRVGKLLFAASGWLTIPLAYILSAIGFCLFASRWLAGRTYEFILNNITGNGRFYEMFSSTPTTSTTTITTTTPTSIKALPSIAVAEQSTSAALTPTSPSSALVVTSGKIVQQNGTRNSYRFGLSLLAILGILLAISYLPFKNKEMSIGDFMRSIPFKPHFWSDNSERKFVIPVTLNGSDGEGGALDGAVDPSQREDLVLTYDDLRLFIADEVRASCMNGDNSAKTIGQSVDPRTAELRGIISDEVKSFCTSEVKDRVKNEVKAEVKEVVEKEITHAKKLRATYKGTDLVDIIRQESQKVIEEALLVFSQDKLNRPDFALHSAGAKVISRITSKTYEVWPEKWFAKLFAYMSGQGILRGKPPVTALSPDTNVGQCWPFPGREGQLAVLLSRKVYVTAVTYDHVSKHIGVDVTSAPRDFEVWGIVNDGKYGRDERVPDEDDEEDIFMESKDEECGVREDGEYVPYKNSINNNVPEPTKWSDLDPTIENLASSELRLGTSTLHLFLGRYTYDIHGNPVQTFEVPESIKQRNKPVTAVVMKVLNNWSKDTFTCLYRFRVHGDPVDRINE
ncbi:8757_t:CDS:1 [Paraglomus occultum]|uniref:8757_t:CDS:1 n=1 Tax=Paraglomus occultum TaxID=144539 RepID=A0A9N8VY55_9GLOM|nr:8757_t:CDS:1 [Paraglomus occultum]